MKCVPSTVFHLLLFIFPLVLSVHLISALSPTGSAKHSIKFILGGQNLGPWKNGVTQVAQAARPRTKGTLVLAANRTNRPDILHGFRRYQGGWDIANRHYWASVGFTGVAGLTLAVLWFISFGLALVIHLCCGWGINIKDKGSNRLQRIWTGCIVLSFGQDKFHGEAVDTLHYVVNQSDYTVQTLRNVTEYLALAKTIAVAEMFLPSNIMDDIDKLNVDLNSAANTLSEQTKENSFKIRKASSFDYDVSNDASTGSNWVNAICDTCMAMGEWVENPHAESALSNILPCVDQRTTNKTLFQSKQVVTNIVSIVNRFIYDTADASPAQGSMNYYNQSGPAMPPLCYPFDSQFRERQCTPQEVSSANASLVWKRYECKTSEYGVCTTIGRVTPEIYLELVQNYNSNQKIEDLDIDGREKEDGNRGEVQETELKTLLKKLEGKGWYEEN
ncbi:hypothetical protein JHK82_050812 [Glycine max]|nr:hypothetical protein JHK86_050668 [Glycine max]KAG4936590.1 hypothetical protein JHK85_051509 [Glycine max]KAG5092034.1 hypothetical protein JHK82_050812 [Glycine max]KAG5095088.1 hypothetical protein JHK84_050676 [Glycine max]